MPVTSQGAIALTILPSPQLDIAGVTLGNDATSRVHAQKLQLGLALMPLLRGQIQLRSTRLEGVEAIVQLSPDGALVLPRSDQAARPASFDSIEIMRATVTVLRGERPLAMAVPVALEASSPSRSGPWRIAGEIGGRPVRIATGEAANGQTRLRITLPPLATPGLETDGSLSLAGGKLAYAGTWQLRHGAIKPPAAAHPANSRSIRRCWL